MGTFSLFPVLFLTAIAFMLSFAVSLKRRWLIIASLSIVYIISLNQWVGFFFILLAILNYTVTTLFRERNWPGPALITINLLFLIYYKYLLPIQNESYLLPIGISIFVFQQLSFLIDVNIRKSPLNGLSHYFSYSFLFSNIATGPILQYSPFVNDPRNQLYFSGANLTSGIFYIIFGCFKIMAVAGNLSILTSHLYLPDLNPNIDLLIPFLFNKYEIYANFSGYTDVAIGIGLIFGISLPQNFNNPFHTSSIIEFWKRWHMSLTSWIRNYIFYPLVTSPFGKAGPYAIMLVTFMVFAIWHGLKWTYICYAIVQVLLIYFANQVRKLNIKSNKYLMFFPWIWFYVFSISIPGVLFRSQSLNQFRQIMTSLITHSAWEKLVIFAVNLKLPLILGCIALIMVEYVHTKKPETFIKIIHSKNPFLRTIIFSLGVLVVFAMASINQTSGFIYSLF